jgi:pimeloyl-ACP methyl ester carboxylesterase
VVSDHGVDQARAVEIGGVRQWITIRGRDARNPILLVLHGGPAAPDIPARWAFEGPWTDYFTVVEWDQRGGGKTFALDGPGAPAATKDRLVADTEELIAWLRSTYGRRKIFVVGHSWGSVLGLEMARRHPDWLYAYIGVGQIISMRAGERIGYAWTLAQARKAGDARAIADLEAIAPYPEPDGTLPLDKIDIERRWSVHYGGLTHNRDSYAWWENLERLSPDYSEADFKAIDAGSAQTLPALLPAMAATDFTSVTRLRCPILMFAGRFDYTTPSAPVKAWFDRLRAPSKRFVWFENSAHMIYGEEPGKFLVSLVRYARPLATDAPAP